jgi:hypothetical protein
MHSHAGTYNSSKHWACNQLHKSHIGAVKDQRLAFGKYVGLDIRQHTSSLNNMCIL